MIAKKSFSNLRIGDLPDTPKMNDLLTRAAIAAWRRADLERAEQKRTRLIVRRLPKGGAL